MRLIINESAQQGSIWAARHIVEAIKAKAELISEMRLLLQCIDVTALNYPDKDYSKLIAKINYELKTERAQLRNLQTRRMKKKTAP